VAFRTYVWALYWAARGFRVFPLEEGGHRPRQEGWTETATTDPELIWRWWHTDSPIGPIEQHYNIGILTTGMLVVDIDVKKGKQGLINFFELHGEFDTLTVRTRSNGYHLFYRIPYEVAGSQGDRGGIAPGIDGRAFHNYVVAAGSVMADGHCYTIEIDMPIATVPDVILSRCKPPGERIRDRFTTSLIELDTDYAKQLVIEDFERAEGVMKGQGLNTAIYVRACAGRDLGVGEDTNLDLMVDHWLPKCSPVGREEAAAIVANAYQYAQNPAGMKHPAVAFRGIQIEPPTINGVVLNGKANGHANGHTNGELFDTFAWNNTIPMRLLKPRPWVAKPLLLRGSVTMLIAPGGVGKSLVTLLVAIFLALGRDVWKFKNAYRGTPKRSVIYNAEDSRAEMSMRLHAACIDLQVDPALVTPYIMLISGKEKKLRLVTLENRNPILHLDNVAKLVEQLQHPDCVFGGLDPLVKLHGVHESDNVEMSYVMEILDLVAEKSDTSLLVPHHTAKPPIASSGSYVGNADSGRGAGAIRDSARSAFTVSPPTDEDAQKFSMTVEDRRRLVRIDDAKMNHALLGDPPLWLEKRTVTLWNGEEVGTFAEADVQDRTENLRQHIGKILAIEMATAAKASMTIAEALNVLRRSDPIFGQVKLNDARQRLEQLMVRPIELDADSRVIELLVSGGTKVLALR
jgi:bifunctional DNA primase/polymerase-like protein/AAA domain-containing protein